MTETYKQIEAGTISPDDVLSSSIPELNRIFDIDPENAELTEGDISLTVSQALNQMITISHNYAAFRYFSREN
jgi:beta-lactamase class A